MRAVWTIAAIAAFGGILAPAVPANASGQTRATELRIITGLRDGVQSYSSARAVNQPAVTTLLLADLKAAQSAVRSGGSAPAVFSQFVADVAGQRGKAIYAPAADVLTAEANGTTAVGVEPVSPTAASTVSSAVHGGQLTVGVPASSAIGSVSLTDAGTMRPITVPSGRRRVGAAQVKAFTVAGKSNPTPAQPLSVSLTFGPSPGSDPASAELEAVDPVTKREQRLATTTRQNADGTYTATALSSHVSSYVVSAPATTGTIAGFAGSGGEGSARQVAQFGGPLLVRNGVLYISDPGGFVRAVDMTTGYEVIVAGEYGWLATNGDGGPATSATLVAPGGLAFDAAGDLYIADTNTIRKVDLNGIISTYASTATNLASSPATMAFGPDGSLYVAEPNAGLERIDPSGATSMQSFGEPTDVSVDASGDVYVAWVDGPAGGPNTENVSRIDPSGTTTLLFSRPGYSGLKIALDNAGHLLFADRLVNAVGSLDLSSGTATTVAGTGAGGFSGDGGPATAATIESPDGVAVDANGAFYVSDGNNMRVRRIDYGGTITTFAGVGRGQFSGDGGPATAAEIISPTGVAADRAGNVYVADYMDGRVRKIDQLGTITTVVAGVHFVTNLAVDPAGDIFLNYFPGWSGRCATTILKVDPSGNQTVIEANACESGAMATDLAGDLYFVDGYPTNGLDVVKEWKPNGTIAVVAGSGSGGDGGPATQASLSGIMGLAVDPAGDLFIAEMYGNRVHKVDTHGVITTVAGTGTAGFSGDGVATAVELSSPEFLATDASGNLYINDYGNHRIRRLDAKGMLTTVVGTGLSSRAADSGLATASPLAAPMGIAFDAAGNLYVADQAANAIREVAA